MASVELNTRRNSALFVTDFHVFDAPLKDGEELFLVGSAPELGRWNVASAVGPLRPLTRAERAKRNYSGLAVHGARVTFPGPAMYEYKFVIRRSDGRLDWAQGHNEFGFVNASSTLRHRWNSASDRYVCTDVQLHWK